VVVVNIGAVADTTSVKTGAKVVITMPLPGSSREGRPPDKVEEQRSAKNEQMKQMVQEMQSQIDSMNVSLEFSTYGENGEKIAVVVADKDTGEVIREIPSKEIQNLYAKMREITGILFNMQA
jgi:flagellar protein FlaG